MNRTRSIDEDLTNAPLFRGLSTRQLRRISSLATRIMCEPGRALTRQGRVGTEFFVLLDGDVEVRTGDRVVATRGPGDHLGEIALLGMQRQTATAVTTTPVEVAVMSKAGFLSLLGEAPELLPALHLTMTRRLAELGVPTGR